MIGQLLHSFGPSRQRLQRITPLDSHTEEAHTRSLLFPDAHVLNQPISLSDSLPGDVPLSAANATNATDCGVADIDLETPRDVRIIIAQNFTGQQDPAVLFDSWLSNRPESPEAQPVTTPHTAPPSRRASIVSSDSGRRSPSSFGNTGAFQRSRLRNTSVSTTLPFIDETAPVKSKDDPIRTTALECMFENAQSSYKGTSNRIHIIPLEPRPNETVLSSPTFADGPTSLSSLGKLAGQRRSHLATSYTPGETVPALPRSDGTRTPRTLARDNRRRTVLISRTFSVPWLDEWDMVTPSNEPTPTASDPNPTATAWPFPRTVGPGKLRIMPSQGGSKTLPMYGISIVLQLPVAPPANAPRRNQSGYFPPMAHGPESAASSLGSEGRTGGWSFVDSMLGVQSSMSDSFSSDVDDRVDLVGQHWDVISRSLTALQFLAQDKILTKLKPQARVFRPQLQPNALWFDEDVKHAVDSTCRRLVRGFKIPRVRTGQGRWGIWREEVLWLTRWTSGKEQGAFVLRLLTAFLAQHSDWMKVLGPKSYRKRYREQQDTRSSEDLTVPSRTVIVADSKMAARRIIFLLSAFLPAVRQIQGATSPGRPGTAASLRAYSQSPPGAAGLSRQELLRRTVNRHGRTGTSLSRLSGKEDRTTTGSDPGDDRTLTGDDRAEVDGHRRRGSDARFIIGAPLLGANHEETNRKSSAATTDTITPETAVPAAHFSTHRNSSSTDLRSLHRRPGSSGSLASANLVNALQRDNTGGSTESTGGISRWGSIRSLWSAGSRQESSTDYGDILQSTDEGLGILSLNGSKLAQSRSSNKLEQMALEAEAISARSSFDGTREHLYHGNNDHQSPDIFAADGDEQEHSPRPSTAQPVTDRREASESPFKLTVDESGVIDVQIPFSNFSGSPPPRSPFWPPHVGNGPQRYRDGIHHEQHSASFNSTGSNSPSHPYFPIFASQLSQPNPTDTTHPLNVAGWLTYLHADFTLQAVKPYAGLMQDIKAAMSAEPTPPSAMRTSGLEFGPVDKWVDVGQCLVADTRTWTLRRISLRRLVRLVPVLGQPAVTPGVTPGAAPLGMASRGAAERAASRNRYGLPYETHPSTRTEHSSSSVVMSEIHLQEEWKEEIVLDMDETLVEALGHVVDGTGYSATPATLSRSNSHRGSEGTEPQQAVNGRHTAADEAEGPVPSSSSQSNPTLNVGTSAGMAPRETKRVILGALEKIVSEVVIERKEDDGESLQPGEFEARTSIAHPQTSILRQGVSKWLTEIEEGSDQLRH